MTGVQWLRRVGVAGFIVVATLLGLSSAASAHPLGNATVNHYDGLHLYADHVTDLAVEDVAEIPTLQRKSLVDTDGDGVVTAGERAAYAAKQCAAMVPSTRLQVDGRTAPWSVLHSDYAERPGVISLTAGRLVCELTAPVDLTRSATVSLDAGWDGDGIGWHEITAVGSGVSLQNSPVPAASISDALLRYPNDLLSSPLNQRSAVLRVVPGAATSTYAAARRIPVAGVAVRELNKLSTAFNNVVGSKHLTVGVGLLALLLSMLLGAGHAFLPGHGKTIMAAYLVGRRGRLRDVVTVGATVTITHTAGVLVLGLLISLTAAFAPTAAEQGLGVVSGLIVAGVGAFLLLAAVRRRPAAALRAAPAGAVGAAESRPARVLVGAATTAAPDAGSGFGPAPAPGHSHDRGASPDHDHSHGHSHGQDHPHGHGHSHGQGEGSGTARFGRGGLVGLGVAGGLVPSPSALLVLLAAVALGRTVFGVLLVLGYGLGMAGALMGTGLLLVVLRNRLVGLTSRRGLSAGRLSAVLPVVTAVLVLLVGVGLTLRALAGTV
ncbi:MAG: High-affinity nickel-transporter [Actinomycetota bacterium]|nr:High-affinity nickel-transporter [Actinomycetota bacterium]